MSVLDAQFIVIATAIIVGLWRVLRWGKEVTPADGEGYMGSISNIIVNQERRGQ